MKSENILLLPGWQNSDPLHWQSLWQAQQGFQRVEQHDWMHPLRGDWMGRLEEVLLSLDGPAVLVAHSLGCQLVAAWAAYSHNTHRVKAALLVAPGDAEREELSPVLSSWTPLVLAALPFPSTLVASSDDPYCTLARATQFAGAWGSRLVNIGARGHINSASGLGTWPDGQALLHELINI